MRFFSFNNKDQTLVKITKFKSYFSTAILVFLLAFTACSDSSSPYGSYDPAFAGTYKGVYYDLDKGIAIPATLVINDGTWTLKSDDNSVNESGIYYFYGEYVILEHNNHEEYGRVLFFNDKLTVMIGETPDLVSAYFEEYDEDEVKQ